MGQHVPLVNRIRCFFYASSKLSGGSWDFLATADGAKVPTRPSAKCQSRGYLWKIKSLRAIEATWWPTHTSEGAGHPSRPGSRRRLRGQSARTLPGSTSKYLSPQIKVLHPSTFQLTVTSRPDRPHDTSITTKPVVDHNHLWNRYNFTSGTIPSELKVEPDLIQFLKKTLAFLRNTSCTFLPFPSTFIIFVTITQQALQ